MVSNALKALPVAVLLALPAVGLSGDETSEKKKIEKKVVVTDDGVFASDVDEPVVVHVPRWSRRGYLGVRLLEMTPELREHFGAPRDAGVIVAAVEADSPAQKAGIQVGDIITKADGERIESPRDLAHAARGMRSGETLKVEVSRDKATRQLSVQIQERPSREIDLGDLGREIGRGIGRDFQYEFGPRAWAFRFPENYDRFQERLRELEKRLNDLEKKLSR
jgi:membrane-associated protease RseP (regulator of RpoE activity)